MLCSIASLASSFSSGSSCGNWWDLWQAGFSRIHLGSGRGHYVHCKIIALKYCNNKVRFEVLRISNSVHPRGATTSHILLNRAHRHCIPFSGFEIPPRPGQQPLHARGCPSGLCSVSEVESLHRCLPLRMGCTVVEKESSYGQTTCRQWIM